jgi:hypothetical protein
MTNIIDFNAHLKNRKEIKKEAIPIKKTDSEKHFEYALLADYNLNELYINVIFEKFNINVDISINLDILTQLYTINPLTRLTKKTIQEITELDSEFVTAIFQAYIEFEFIDPITMLIRSKEEIANSYIKKRLEIGYPKSKKEFDRILKLEKEVFNKYLNDTSIFNEELYWKSKKSD